MIGPFTKRLFEWVYQEGFADESLRDKDWIGFGLRVFEGSEPASELDRATAALEAFLATKTKAELLAAALERNLLIAPITTTRDVLRFEQLEARRYWEDVDGVRYPGPVARFGRTPLAALAPAPALGADGERILAEPRQRRVSRRAPAPTGRSRG